MHITLTKYAFYAFLGLCGLCCFCCLLCRVSGKMNESCCVSLFLPGGLVALRTKLRTEFGISVCSYNINLRQYYIKKECIGQNHFFLWETISFRAEMCTEICFGTCVYTYICQHAADNDRCHM